MEFDPTNCCSGDGKYNNAETAPRNMKRTRCIDSSNSANGKESFLESIQLKKNKKSSTDGEAVVPTNKLISPEPEWAQAPKDTVVCTPDITMMFNNMNGTESPPSPILHTAVAVNPTTLHSNAVYQHNQSTPNTAIGLPSTSYPIYLSTKPNGKHGTPSVILQVHNNAIQPTPVVPPTNTVVYSVPHLQQNPNSGNTPNQPRVWCQQQQLQPELVQRRLKTQQFVKQQLQQNKLHKKQLEQQLKQHNQQIQQLQQKLDLAQNQLKKADSLTKQTYPMDALGQTRTRLQSQISSTQELCQNIIAKLNTLTNSNAYKEVQNYNDVKGLHIHVSYLYKYTMEKFKQLYEFNQNDIKKLDIANGAANALADRKANYKSEDNDLNIVENTQVVISLDSDSDTETSDRIHQSPADTIASSSSIALPATQHVGLSNQESVDTVDQDTVCISDDSDCDTELLIPPILDVPKFNSTVVSRLNSKAISRPQMLEVLVSPTPSENFATNSIELKNHEKDKHITSHEHTGSTKSTRDEASTPDVENQDSSIFLLDPIEPDIEDNENTIYVTHMDSDLPKSNSLDAKDPLKLEHFDEPTFIANQIVNDELCDKTLNGGALSLLDTVANDDEHKYTSCDDKIISVTEQ